MKHPPEPRRMIQIDHRRREARPRREGSALDAGYRTHADDPAGEAGGLRDRGDLVHVLVGARGLLGRAFGRMRLDDDSPLGELADQRLPMPAGLRLRAAHRASGAVAGGAEGARLRLARAGENEGAGPHGPADQDRLADCAVLLGQLRVAGPEGARGSLAVHEEEALDPAHLVLLGLAGVVRDVVEEAQARLSEVAGEDLPDESADHLPVGQRAVDAGPHRGEILLSFRRPDRSAGQLAIRERDAVTGGQRHELLQELGADLAAEAARAAVDRHEEIAFFETEGPGRLAVEDRLDGLQLQIVVARTEASDLVELPLLRPPADSGGVGSPHAAPALDA